jgi:hypothetical protein
MGERRIVNKMNSKPVDVDVSTENITVKVPTTEERIAAIENYIAAADPYIRSLGELQEIKRQLVLFNDEITRIAGVQSRANSYIDGKFSQIEETLNNVIMIVKKHDDDYRELMSDVEEPDTLYEEESKPEDKSTV